MSKTFKNRPVIPAIVILAAALVLSACGTERPTDQRPAQVNCGQGQTCTPINSAPNGLLGILLGDYYGTMKLNGVDMNYTLRLSTINKQVQDPNSNQTVSATYGFAAFHAQGGGAKPIDFSTELGLGQNGYTINVPGVSSPVYVYSFLNYQFAVPAISDENIGIEITLAVHDNAIFPAQSKVSILDCGFSQGVCTNSLWYVSFPDGLRKR
jgi:hypothetical protein